MKKLLIQIDVKDELPDKVGYYLTDTGILYYFLKQWVPFPSFDDFVNPKFWYKEVDQRTYDVELLEKYLVYLEKTDWKINLCTTNTMVINGFLE